MPHKMVVYHYMSDSLSLEERIDSLFRQPVFLLVGGGLVIYAVTAWIWWSQVYTSPRAVFEGMLAKNLSTTGVTSRHDSKEVNGLTVHKVSQLQFGAANLVRISAQTSQKTTGTTIETETVATSNREVNRYTAIRTNQPGKDGKPFDAESVVGKWADGPDGSTAFTQTVLQPYAFLMGDVPARTRDQLVGFLRDNLVYDANYAVKRGTTDGRPTYTYTVNVQPVAYIAFVKSYAKALGLNDLDSVDPAQAQGSQAIPATVTVDVRSHRLVKVDYPTLNYSETYSDYNVPRSRDIPAAELSSQRLQDLVSQLQ